MTTKNKRFMLSVNSDMEKEVEIIKKLEFYNKPYSEVYRYLIGLGIKANKDANAKKIIKI